MIARAANALLGIWLMSAPAVLGYGNPAANHDHIAGPLAATFAIISVAEVTRSVRWMNVILGVWLLAAPWILGYRGPAPIVNSMVVGVLLGALGLVRGTVREQVGGGWRMLWTPEREGCAGGDAEE